MSEEKYAHYERQNTTKGLAGRYFERSKPRSRGCGEKMSKHHHARDTGGGAACYNRDTVSLDRFQAQPIWEMSVDSALAIASCVWGSTSGRVGQLVFRGFSVDQSVLLPAGDQAGIERLIQYMTRRCTTFAATWATECCPLGECASGWQIRVESAIIDPLTRLEFPAFSRGPRKTRMTPRLRRTSVMFVSCIALAVSIAMPGEAEEPYGRHQFDDEICEHWSFRPFTRPNMPQVSNPDWVRTPIDAFVLEGLDEAGLKPAAQATRATLLRRVYLDLIGLPPSTQELDAYLADTSPDAFENVVDDLLNRPQFGERWARHWLDVVRYAETNGYERDGQKPEAWRYRDWVINALNGDMPYDEFLTQQLAGDEIDGSDADSQIATTMLRLGLWDDEPADPLADRYDQLDDIVGTTAATFMGLTLRCARCHDHKFEPFSQKDYTRWLANFAPLKRPRKERVELARDLGPRDLVEAHHALVKKLDEQKQILEDQVATLQWQVYTRAASDGRIPLAAAGDEPSSESVPPKIRELAEKVPGDALSALGLEPAKRDDAHRKLVAKHRSELVALVDALATDEDRGRFDAWSKSLEETKSQYPASLPKGYVWYEEGPTAKPTHLFKRGDPRSPDVEIAPGFPAVLVNRPPPAPTPTAHSSGRRLQTARWLSEADHPLSARVMVNRIWQHHFGDGIVATENDFGVRGAPPTHPELLDWLASEFVAGGWRMKPMHRMMVLSATYRMASTENVNAEAVDPSGKLLWRYKPRRMSAEALRDSILSVSGQLNATGGGPSVYPKISRAVLETQSRPGNGWGESSPSEASRRSIYVFVKRTLLVPELEVLDFPSTEQSCEQRVVSTVAPQALTFLNGEFIHEQATAFAERLVREVGDEDTVRIVRAYRLAFSRLPSDAELAAVLRFLNAQQAQIQADSQGKTTGEAARGKALAALCLVLLNTNEFAYVQ